MTLHSPDKEAPRSAADSYLESWDAMSHLVMEQGASWSGREKNCVFLNLADGRFANISASSHADYPDDARAVALLDWDCDGALDLVIKNRSAPRLRVLRNQAASGSHWVQFKLRGTGESNRDAIGARVRVIRGEEAPRVASLRAGDGYLSQNTRFLHFGLGNSGAACSVEVTWPDGTVESFGSVEVDRIWRLVQGAGNAVEVTRERIGSLAHAPTSALAKSDSEERRVVLADRLPMSAFPLPSYDQPGRTVADFEGGPILINLWGLTCANCFKELAEFRDAADQFAAAGLRVVPLSTDGEDEQERAREVIGKLGHGALAGPTDPKQFEALQLLFSEMLGESAPSYLPSSLLLDAQGRVCVVYQGPVSIETLLDDVARIGRMRAGNRFTGQLESGRWLATRLRGFRGLAKGLRASGHAELAEFYEELATRDAAMRR